MIEVARIVSLLLSTIASFTRIDPAQEIARLRHSISLLEAYVFPNQRNAIPQRRASDAATFIVPKKEFIEADVNEKGAAAPGVLGSHVQGGLYAGSTSVATHLMVHHFLYSHVVFCLTNSDS